MVGQKKKSVQCPKSLDDLGYIYSDNNVTNDDIDLKHQLRTEEEAFDMLPHLDNGDYISIINGNDLSEAFIYRKLAFEERVKPECLWDGSSSDASWYDADESVQHIQNAAQLKGLYDLVMSGITFEGKEVRLDCNIDLCSHEWTPIGDVYKLDREKGNSLYTKYDINISPDKVFKGIFNGCAHIIYNMTITKKYGDANFFGFFLVLKNAVVKNIIFSGVDMHTTDSTTNYASVCGVAENCRFMGIDTSGSISCAKPSGICGIGYSSVFYNCRNDVTLTARVSDDDKDTGIVIGGICQQITLSRKSIDELYGSSVPMFKNCVNTGKIYADGTNAKYLWIGSFFGGTYYEKGVYGFSFTIDRCNMKNSIAVVSNSDKVKGECIFSGYKDNIESITNNIGNSCKDDLLAGAIGRVDQYIDIHVIKSNPSIMLGALVIPGSANTLHSKSGSKTFITEKAEIENNVHCIYNLVPFYKYIKTIHV